MSRDQFSAIYHAGSSLTGARLKRARNEWSLGAPERQELPAPVDAKDDDAVQIGASHEVRRFTSSFQDSLAICLESRIAQFQYLSMPLADESEIRDMVALQIEERKLLPLLLEEMTLAIEPLGKTEDSLQLLVAAVPTANLDTLPATTGLAKARIQRIDIGALACLRSLRETPDNPLFAPGRHLLLLNESGYWTLVVVDHARPVLVRPLGPVQTPPRVLLRTLRLSLLQVESELSNAAPIASATFLSPMRSTEFEEAVREAFQCDLHADASEVDALCACGAARRSTENSTFDLVPAAWREELADRNHRRRLLQVVVGGIALWGLAAAALFLGPSLLDKAIASEESSLQALDPAVQTVSDVRHRVRLIQSYMDRSFAPLEVLREVCEILPEGITFSSLRYRREDSRVAVEASATSTALVYEFKQNVDKDELFAESQLTRGPTSNTRTGGAEFELTMLLNTPPAEEGGTEP